MLTLPCLAHTGTETETSVNLTKTGVSVVTRCTPELAWILLGPGAPRGPLEAAFEAAKPELEKLAPALVRLHSGETELTPRSVRVVLEPGRHVAFVLRFGKSDGPLDLRAPFLARVDALEPTVVRFYDHTNFRRAAEPFATLELQNATQSACFELGKAQRTDP